MQIKKYLLLFFVIITFLDCANTDSGVLSLKDGTTVKKMKYGDTEIRVTVLNFHEGHYSIPFGIFPNAKAQFFPDSVKVSVNDKYVNSIISDPILKKEINSSPLFLHNEKKSLFYTISTGADDQKGDRIQITGVGFLADSLRKYDLDTLVFYVR